MLALGLSSLALPALAACNRDTGLGGPPQNATPRVTPAPGSQDPSASGSPSAPESSSGEDEIPVSKDLDKIKVKGKKGTEPKITVPAPWGIDKTRVKVLDAGDGATVPKGAPVTVSYHGVNGRTGETFDSSWQDGEATPITFSLDGVVAGFRKGLQGQKVGSRVLIAMPGKDGYDEQGGSGDGTIMVGDTLIFVVEIEATLLSGPEGKAVAPKDGLPTVEDTKKGPKITIPKTKAPTKLTHQPLVKGSGPEVAETDTVHLRYRGVVWDSGKVVDDNYGDDVETTTLGDTLIPGFTKGIIGQTVGSRMLLVIPPKQGYPDGNDEPKVPKDSTLVYVVDILFAQATQGQ